MADDPPKGGVNGFLGHLQPWPRKALNNSFTGIEQAYRKRKGPLEWKPSENKFKCPRHGSGYDSKGVNFESPAPRPMDRAHIERSPDGQILVDVSRLNSGRRRSRASSMMMELYLSRNLCATGALTVRRETG